MRFGSPKKKVDPLEFLSHYTEPEMTVMLGPSICALLKCMEQIKSEVEVFPQFYGELWAVLKANGLRWGAKLFMGGDLETLNLDTIPKTLDSAESERLIAAITAIVERGPN